MNLANHPSLNLDIRSTDGATVISVSGSANMVDSILIQEQLERLSEMSIPLLVLDLTELEFIGADGIDKLLVSRELLRRHEGQIRLVNPTPMVLRLLELTRLTHVFPIFPTLDEALKP